MTTLLLFDIDGTLVLTGGAGGRAMTRAFDEIFSIPNGFHGISMAGRTDAWILADAAAAHGISPDSPELARFPEIYLPHLAREIQEPASSNVVKAVMPGIPELLESLSALCRTGDVFLALLTGNYEAAARLKLEYFDLWRYFSCGAFGDGALDRNVLLPKAIRRVTTVSGLDVRANDTILIGDTPLDIACAVAGGARSIAVATGSFTRDQLREAGADVTFRDLSQTSEVLAQIALLARGTDVATPTP
ncbi:MAG TPA: HAD family hydrolase [Vicinamibacterales bacterium]|nr:HAD family hydrolase [Vicinamibacterales bacterium]